MRLMVVRQTGREEEPHAPTDKWTSQASTAGQRAIHIGRHHKGWAIVPPTGLQRSVAAANLHLKQNLAVGYRIRASTVWAPLCLAEYTL